MITVILSDSMDRHLGIVKTYERCRVLRHCGAHFARTERTARLHPHRNETAPVFEQVEIFVHDKLEPL